MGQSFGFSRHESSREFSDAPVNVNGYLRSSIAGDLLVHAEIRTRTRAIRWLLLWLYLSVMGIGRVQQT